VALLPAEALTSVTVIPGKPISTSTFLMASSLWCLTIASIFFILNIPSEQQDQVPMTHMKDDTTR